MTSRFTTAATLSTSSARADVAPPRSAAAATNATSFFIPCILPHHTGPVQLSVGSSNPLLRCLRERRGLSADGLQRGLVHLDLRLLPQFLLEGVLRLRALLLHQLRLHPLPRLGEVPLPRGLALQHLEQVVAVLGGHHVRNLPDPELEYHLVEGRRHLSSGEEPQVAPHLGVRAQRVPARQVRELLARLELRLEPAGLVQALHDNLRGVHLLALVQLRLVRRVVRAQLLLRHPHPRVDVAGEELLNREPAGLARAQLRHGELALGEHLVEVAGRVVARQPQHAPVHLFRGDGDVVLPRRLEQQHPVDVRVQQRALEGLDFLRRALGGLRGGQLPAQLLLEVHAGEDLAIHGGHDRVVGRRFDGRVAPLTQRQGEHQGQQGSAGGRKTHARSPGGRVGATPKGGDGHPSWQAGPHGAGTVPGSGLDGLRMGACTSTGTEASASTSTDSDSCFSTRARYSPHARVRFSPSNRTRSSSRTSSSERFIAGLRARSLSRCRPAFVITRSLSAPSVFSARAAWATSGPYSRARASSERKRMSPSSGAVRGSWLRSRASFPKPSKSSTGRAFAWVTTWWAARSTLNRSVASSSR